MKTFKKCLVLLIFLMFFAVGDVNAISFKRNGYIKYYSDSYNYRGVVSSKPNDKYYTYYKEVVESNGQSNGQAAYCAQYNKQAPNTNVSYSDEDDDYANNKNCGPNKNVDCSTMIGHIIVAGNNNNIINGDKYKKYYFTQLAIQTYLYNYSNGDYRYKNDGVANVYKISDDVKRILNEAARTYESEKEQKIVEPAAAEVFDNNNFGLYISSEDKLVDDSTLKTRYSNMYYDSKNYYVSYYVKLKGPSEINSKVVKYKISTNKDNVEFCDVEEGVCGEEISIGLNKDFYIRTNDKEITSLDVIVRASVQYNIGGSVWYYDSKRYNSKNSKKQDMIVLDEGTNTIGGSPKLISDSKTYTFNIVKISKLTCNTWLGLSDDSDGCISKTVNNSCQSNLYKEQKNNSVFEKSTAYFRGCSSQIVTISYFIKTKDGYEQQTASVGVLIHEIGNFVYRGIKANQNPLYAGGGFGLLENLDTSYYDNYYENSFSYNYKYVYDSDKSLYVYYGNKYFVDGESIVYSSDNGSFGKSAKEYFKEQLLNGIMTPGFITDLTDELQNTTFLSYDSNNYSRPESYISVPVNVISNYNEVIKSEKWLPGSDYKKSIRYEFNLKNASRNLETGNIEYKDLINDNKYVDLGQRYYTYIKYSGSKYPFNVSTNKLRAVKVNDCTWNVNSPCDVDLVNDIFDCEDDGKCSILVRYRSIDVNNPFPKATTYNDVPFNWRAWYYNNSNKVRLKNTYNQYIYKLELNANNISVISVDRDYTSWNNMFPNGSSKFINKDFVTYFDNKSSNSYCKLGEFSSKCDK